MGDLSLPTSGPFSLTGTTALSSWLPFTVLLGASLADAWAASGMEEVVLSTLYDLRIPRTFLTPAFSSKFAPL